MENSLAKLRPDLVAEWDIRENFPLSPEDFTCNSNKQIVWVCKNGHRWAAPISRRNRGASCPYCSGRLAIQGETDLATIAPAVAAEWHPTLNGKLFPTMVTVGSKKKVYWVCSKGHVWQASINDRSNGCGCPYCHNRIACGDNSLATLFPQIATEWHPTKNGKLTPNDVTPGSHKKVWWKCSHGHEWQAMVYSRKARGCPVCGNKIIIVGINDLETANPELAAEWHPTLNGNLTPQMVPCSSTKRAWWKCPKGHEWNATIYSRHEGANCPVCSGRIVQSGVNDLETLAPQIAAEWHPTKNGDKLPTTVAAGSGFNAWWKCSHCGFEWQAPVTHRYHRAQQCPACNGRIQQKEKLL